MSFGRSERSIYEHAKTLENIMVTTCQGVPSEVGTYEELRWEFVERSDLNPLLPEFVRTCRDLKHFWSYIRNISPHWEPRRCHVREKFVPLFEHLEGKNKSPGDAVATDVLSAFDSDGIKKVWEKALERRHADPAGAITTARTLLETVCKKVLEETGIEYADSEDLPALYKKVATRLRIAPSQHTEDTFKRILGGATSVVEGLGSLRNKIGDAHGKGGKPVKVQARHAQLAVNLAGAMATFIIETWIVRGVD